MHNCDQSYITTIRYELDHKEPPSQSMHVVSDWEGRLKFDIDKNKFVILIGSVMMFYSNKLNFN